MRAGRDAALGDDDAVARRVRDKLELGVAIDTERAEITCIHSDHRCPERRRPGQFDRADAES